MAYPITIWQDEVDEYEDLYIESESSEVSGATKHTRYTGTVQQQGTLQDAAHFNNMEHGILDAHIAAGLILNAHRQSEKRIEDLETATEQENGTVTLSNSGGFLFNNSKVTVPLTNTRENLNYVVEIVSISGSGNIGEIEISEKQVNGFKICHTGSATSVTVTYAVIGGFD